MIKIWKTSIIAALLLVLFGVASADAPKETPADTSGKLVTLRLARASISPEDAYLHIGVERGIFKKHGVDLQVINFLTGGAEAAAATASGQVDMGSFGAPIVTMIGKGIPIKIVSSPPVKGNENVMTARNDINKVEELRGKQIATGSVGGGWYLSTLKIISAHGLTENDVTLLPSGGIDPVLLYQGNDISAHVGSWEHAVKVIDAGLAHVIAEAKDYYGKYQFSSIFATDKFIAEHPETIVNFIKAYRETLEYCGENVDEVVRRGLGFVQMDENVLREFYKNNIAKWDLSFALDYEGLNTSVEAQKELGAVDEKVSFDPATWTDERFLKEADLK